MDELFTKRNLYALAILMEAIEDEEKKDIRDFLKIAFTSMSHLCARLLAEGRPAIAPSVVLVGISKVIGSHHNIWSRMYGTNLKVQFTVIRVY